MPTRRSAHIHILNEPEVDVYGMRPDTVRARLAGLTRAKRVALTVTESRDPFTITPEMRDAQILVGLRLPTAEIRDLPHLRWIHLVSAGVDHLLPLDWLPANVALTNSSGVHADVAGEYVLAALLMLNIGMPRYIADQRSERWEPVFNSPIRGKTVVLVGVGAIGGAAARLAKRLGLHVVGIRPSRRSHPAVHEMYGPDALLRVLPRADFLVVTAPLTSASRAMIGRRELDTLKPGAGIVNVSRARLIDYDVLVTKLESGELSGAVLDVFHPEPVARGAALWRVRNLVMTPHASADPPPLEYGARTLAIVKRNFPRFLAGAPLLNQVRRERGY